MRRAAPPATPPAGLRGRLYHAGLGRPEDFRHGPPEGAIVVLDIATSEVLAAVSTPTALEGTRMSAERRALEHPEIFRPLSATYPPGSILKPLVLCAAYAEGVVKPGEQIEVKVIV